MMGVPKEMIIIDKHTISSIHEFALSNENGAFLLIDKPFRFTSFQIIQLLRKITGIEKIGHAGTLDPLASGLMIVGIGKSATKQIETYIKLEKSYTATITLGETTASYDLETEPILSGAYQHLSSTDIQNALNQFVGEIMQSPPMFSAIKKGGKRLYLLARKGIEVEVPERAVHIKKISLNEISLPRIIIEVECSSGTYIRTLAHDIGKVLGCGAHLSGLVRTAIASFKLDDAVSIQDVEKQFS